VFSFFVFSPPPQQGRSKSTLEEEDKEEDKEENVIIVSREYSFLPCVCFLLLPTRFFFLKKKSS
jgi:hypothetical protein